MLQMIAGTARNMAKQTMLTQNWEQKKKSGNIFSKQEKNAKAQMTPEQKMLEQFKTEMENNREQSKNNDIAAKIMRGEDLTPEEEQYLSRNNPGQLSNYRRMKEEQKAYEEKLRACKTKDEVQRLKLDTMSAYLSELKGASGEAKSAKAMEIIGKVRNIEKAEAKFVESGEYAKLPTEAEEAIERSEERNLDNEEKRKMLDVACEHTEADEQTQADEHTEAGEQMQADKQTEVNEHTKDCSQDKSNKSSNKDPLEEIEEICSRYISNLNSNSKKINVSKQKESESAKSGNKINIAI